MRFNRRALLALAACAALAGGVSRLAAQGVGSVRGKVVEASTLRPLSGVQVTVPGTGRGGLTDGAGNYLINNVPVGTHSVRAEMLGFGVVTRSFTVPVSEAVVANFELAQQAVALNELVVTGVPGAVSKRTLGNAITKLDAADLTQKTTTTNLAELLQGKTPGLQMIPNAGVPGTASDIRIRGASSLSLSNMPIVFVDGVRYNTSGYGSFTPSGSGNSTYSGQTTSALDGINPADIESIEVIKGPAAATLYGPEAAAGVIQVITKKGKIGQQSVQWNAKVEYGANQMGLSMPDNYTTCDQAKLAQPTNWPGCVGKAAGTQIVSNPLMTDPLAFRNGPVKHYTLTARGGGDNFSYYITGDGDNQDGVQYSSYEYRKAIRANFQLQPTRTVDFTLSTNYARTNLRLPLGDESAEGMMWSGLQGQPGHSPPGGLAIRQDWYGTAPVEVNQYNNQTKIDRMTLGGTLNVRPFEWFKNKLTLGMDYTNSFATVISPPGSVDASYAGQQGIVAQRLPRAYIYNVDYSAMLDRRLGDNLLATTSFGAQYTFKQNEQTNAWGYGFGSPAVTYLGSAQQVFSSNSYSENKALGLFGQEQFGWKDRLYVTGALRVDNNSSFGANIKRYVYPKASLSWVASDEPALKTYFDRLHVDNFKFRTAWGQAGSAPNPYAWNQTYTMDKMIQATATGSSLRTLAYGNPDLKPERGSETEVGFESGLLGDRAGIDFTYYRKNKSDVLISLSAPPSSGFGSSAYYSNQSVQQNLGETLNQGIELALRGTPVLTRNFSWDAVLSLSTNSNKLVKFGNPLVTSMSLGGMSYGTVQYHKANYPLAGYWAKLPKYDASGNLMVDANGYALGTDTAMYIGPSAPTRNASFSSTFTIFRNFRVFGLLDYAGGNYNYNYREYNRCRNRGNCEAMNDANNVNLTNLDWTGAYGPKATAKNATLVSILRSSNVPGYWIQKADFIKFRDLSLTYTVPNSLLRYGVNQLSFTGAVHNIGILWTPYGGVDPEANGYGWVSFSRSDVYEMPMTRRVTFSANVSF